MAQHDDMGTCRNCGHKLWEIDARAVHNTTSFITVCNTPTTE